MAFDKRAYDRAYYRRHREKLKARAKAWRAANAERKRANDAAYYETHRARIDAQAAAWRLAHPERARTIARESTRRRRAARSEPPNEKERELARARNRRYNTTPKGHARARKADLARKARRRGAFVDYVDPGLVFARDMGICGICGDEVSPRAFHVDHVIPLSKGGQHSYENVQLAHPICNRRKGACLGK